MKRNALALSVAAAVGAFGFAGVATAGVIGGGLVTPPPPSTVTSATGVVSATNLVRNNNSTGHILISPYFSTQSGNLTTLHIANTDLVNGKAVKVRFRSAANSDDVFDFQILMSPGDVWTGGVTMDEATGVSKLVTGDTSCTVPPVVNGELFPTFRLPASKTDAERAAMTREGYIEILNMADISSNSGTALDKAVYATNGGALWKATKHVKGTAPCDPAAINALKDNPATAQDAAELGLSLPSGGLFANTAIINVPNTAAYGSQAAALVASTDAATVTPGLANIVFFPQTGDDVANADNATSDPLLRQTAVLMANKLAIDPSKLPLVQPAMYDLPDLSTPYVDPAGAAVPPVGLGTDAPLNQAVALTKSLNVQSVTNEFNVEPGLDASTDWVFSMPTRRYHVAMDYEAASRVISGFDGRVYTSTTVAAGSGTASATPNVFNTEFQPTNTALDTNDKTRICVASGGIAMFDREETTKTTGFVVSPGQATTVRFCGETSVLSFQLEGSSNNPSVLGSTVANQSITTPYINGWANLSAAGKPVLGAAYIKLVNNGARAGVSGNYGLVYGHR